MQGCEIFHSFKSSWLLCPTSHGHLLAWDPFHILSLARKHPNHVWNHSLIHCCIWWVSSWEFSQYEEIGIWHSRQISSKAKEVDECKHEMNSFKSTFVPPREYNFSSKKINILNSPNLAGNKLSLQPRVPRQLSGYCLICFDMGYTNQKLALGYTLAEQVPSPTR